MFIIFLVEKKTPIGVQTELSELSKASCFKVGQFALGLLGPCAAAVAWDSSTMHALAHFFWLFFPFCWFPSFARTLIPELQYVVILPFSLSLLSPLKQALFALIVKIMPAQRNYGKNIVE